MRALLAAAIVAVGVGALGASNALASPANGAAIVKAADEASQLSRWPAVAVAAGTAGRAADAGAIERTNPQAHRSLTAGQGPMRSSAGVSRRIRQDSACVTASAVNLICISQGLGPSFRPPVNTVREHRLQQGARSCARHRSI